MSEGKKSSQGQKIESGKKKPKKIILKRYFIRFEKSIMDRPMDQPTNAQRDMASCRDARTNPTRSRDQSRVRSVNSNSSQK